MTGPPARADHISIIKSGAHGGMSLFVSDKSSFPTARGCDGLTLVIAVGRLVMRIGAWA